MERSKIFADQSTTQAGLLPSQKPEYLLVQLNGSQDSKKQVLIKVKLGDQREQVGDFIQEDIIKKHMNNRGKTYPGAKLYSKNGVELSDDDILYMKTGDTVYLARHGEAFDYQQVLNRYEKVRKLGQGGFGKVYLMREKKDKISDEEAANTPSLRTSTQESLYAVKFINMSEYLTKADGIYEIDREAKTLRMLNSKYIIQLENYFIIQKDIILVMEYARGGELKQYLAKKGGRLPEFEVQYLMKQIMAGLSSCHQKGIIHRDLKLENVLFMDEDHRHLKLVDFGIAGFCLNHLKEKTDAGTFKYMAPEVLKGEINLANPAMDIWATGVMMFLMLYGFHPFALPKERLSKDQELKQLIQSIIHNALDIPQPTLPKLAIGEDEKQDIEIPFVTKECRDLLHALMTKNPKERIQIIDITLHPWFELSEDQIEASHKKQLDLMLDQAIQKEEMNKKRFLASIQKRHTLTIGSQPQLPIPMGKLVPQSNKHQSQIQKKKSTLTPVDNNKYGGGAVGFGKKKSSLAAVNEEVQPFNPGNLGNMGGGGGGGGRLKSRSPAPNRRF